MTGQTIKKSDKMKGHFKRHKERYLYTAAGIFVGGVLVYLGGKYVTINASDEAQVVSNIAEVKPLVNINSPITVNQINELVRRGHPGNVVRCIETGEVFASQSRAAELLGVNRGNLSKHLRGLRDNVGGYTFELVGDAGELLDAKKS